MSSNTNMTQQWYTTEVGSQVTSKKYFHEGEIFDDFVHRVSSVFYGKTYDSMATALENADYFLAGRSLYALGCKGKFKASTSNCYILPSPEDNIESIFDVAGKMARIFASGGGCGVNLSKLRPSGAKTQNAAKSSSGAVSFMSIFDAVGGVIGANNRRAALIIGLNCDHPDIEEFLEVKRNNTAIQSANISILFTDEFMEAVVNNESYELKFTVEATGEVISKTIDSHDFFMKFCEAQHDWCEPGALFIDTVRRNNLMSEYPKEEYSVDICNPCFTGDMRLLTSEGYKEFWELNGNSVNVVSYDGTVSTGKVWCSGEKDTVKVKIRSGKDITCTPDHIFMTIDKQEVMAKDLKGLQIMPYINSGHREYNVLYEKLGFIQGDGQLTRLSSKSHAGLEVNIGVKDRDILGLFGCAESDMLNNGRSIYVTEYTDKLRELEFSAEQLPNREFPKTYDSWNSNDKLIFLRGCYSANGCVMNGANGFRVQYKTTCQGLALKIVDELSVLGISSYITTNKAKKQRFANGEYVCQESYDVNIADYESKRIFYNYIGFIQEYKDTMLLRLLMELAPRVSSVVPNGVHRVYDFSEPNNHWGVVEGKVAHNCAEYTGAAYNACNLASINLYNIIDAPFTPLAHINYPKFTELIELGVRTLDKVLDYGLELQPLQENKDAVTDYRAIGLGIFGLADMFVALGIRYGSPESIEIIHELMDHMQITAITESSMLAKEKGNFAKYDYDLIAASNMFSTLPEELQELIRINGLRNNSLLSIAPTGSLATMCGMSSGVEPYYQVSYERTTHSLEKEGKFFKVFGKAVEHLIRHNYNGYMPTAMLNNDAIKAAFPFVVDAYDVTPAERIAVQATMQKYVDNAISSTLNMKESTTVQEVFDAYIQAWRSGCKGLTIFRENCKRTAILSKPKEVKEPQRLNHITPVKRKSVGKVSGSTVVKHTACSPNMYVTINTQDDNIFEVFTNTSTGCQSNINTITRMASLALRSGVKVEEVTKELRSNTCSACTVVKSSGNKGVSISCGAAIAEAINEIYKGTQIVDEFIESTEYTACPECNELTLPSAAKCPTCSACGYSKCD